MVEKPDKGVLTLCGIEVFGYKNEEKKKDDDKPNTFTSSLDNAAATVEIESDDVVKVQTGTKEIIKTTTDMRYEDTITTVNINTEMGWKKWANELKTRVL